MEDKKINDDLYHMEDQKTEVLTAYEEKRMNLQKRIRAHEEELKQLSFFQFRKKRELKDRIRELQERLRYEEKRVEERVKEIRRQEEELQGKFKNEQ